MLVAMLNFVCNTRQWNGCGILSVHVYCIRSCDNHLNHLVKTKHLEERCGCDEFVYGFVPALGLEM